VPLRECLELCRTHAVTDASVYLLERTGDFVAVLELMLDGYSKALEQLRQCFMEPKSEDRAAMARALKRLAAPRSTVQGRGSCSSRAGESGPEPGLSRAEGSACKEGSTSKDTQDPWWEGVPDAQRCVDLIANAYELSSRNSNLMKADQLEELWFGLLGRTVYWLEKVSASREQSRRHAGHNAALVDLASQAMTGVLAYLSLPNALKWICEKFGASALGIWKESLQRMLSGLDFQQGLLGAAKAVAAQDVVKPFIAVKTKGSRGVRVLPPFNCPSLNVPANSSFRVELVAASGPRGATAGSASAGVGAVTPP